METNGGVDILNVRAVTIIIGDSCGVGHLRGWGKVIDHSGNRVWLAIGEGDGEGHGFVTVISGVGLLLYGLGNFNNHG